MASRLTKATVIPALTFGLEIYTSGRKQNSARFVQKLAYMLPTP